MTLDGIWRNGVAGRKWGRWWERGGREERVERVEGGKEREKSNRDVLKGRRWEGKERREEKRKKRKGGGGGDGHQSVGSVHQPVTVTRPDSGTALPHTLLETIVDYALNSWPASLLLVSLYSIYSCYCHPGQYCEPLNVWPVQVHVMRWYQGTDYKANTVLLVIQNCILLRTEYQVHCPTYRVSYAISLPEYITMQMISRVWCSLWCKTSPLHPI